MDKYKKLITIFITKAKSSQILRNEATKWVQQYIYWYSSWHLHLNNNVGYIDLPKFKIEPYLQIHNHVKKQFKHIWH